MTGQTKTPPQWAEAKGLVRSWQVAAAAALHGWNEHEYHSGAPIELADADFDGAIAAVSDKHDGFTRFEPAVSPYAHPAPKTQHTTPPIEAEEQA